VRRTPLLILAYNRPDKVRGLIDALRDQAPPLVMVVVDGPKPGDEADEARVQAVRDAVSGIDWDAEVRTRFRPVNVGLRASVVDAVSWAIAEYGQVAVIEEDVIPGPDFLPYVEFMLDAYRHDERVMHISGYNVVPLGALKPGAMNRLTVYPESVAWATWDRAWAHYDDELTWLDRRRARELTAITGSRLGAIRWAQNFGDARAQRISTWAYRWIASIWATGGLILSPNVNLVRYVGYDEGTHTATEAAWTELPLYTGPREKLLVRDAERDPAADAWEGRTAFRATPAGVLRGVAVTAVLELRKRRRARRAR
jgi:hypothetical protein